MGVMNTAGPGEVDFESWYRREQPRLVGAVTVAAGSAEIAQDVVSEAFSRALERWDRVSVMESPTGWVRQVAFNVLRRRQRRAGLERRLLARRTEPLLSPLPTIEPELWAAVATLPARQRAVLGLRVVLDLSQAETARLLGISEGTVSTTLIDARRSVARKLTGPRLIVTDRTEADRA